MKIRYLLCSFLMIFLVSHTISCSSNITTSDLSKTYSSSEIVHGEDGIDVVFQNIVSAPHIKLPTSIANVRKFPYSYLNTEGKPMKIIKITRDGNTLDLLIDQPNNTTAYIIEQPENPDSIPQHTNAVFSVNRYTAQMFPVDSNMDIAMVTFSLQNRTRSKKPLEEIPMYCKDTEGNQYPFDTYISESLMTCEYPEILRKDDIYSLRYLCLIPKNLETIYVFIDGVTFLWNMESSEE